MKIVTLLNAKPVILCTYRAFVHQIDLLNSQPYLNIDTASLEEKLTEGIDHYLYAMLLTNGYPTTTQAKKEILEILKDQDSENYAAF